MDNISLFIYTFREYMRFSNNCSSHELIDKYDEKEYCEINIKLMLLRKYVNIKENVYIGTIINESMQKYPSIADELEEIKEEFEKIENQQIEQILPDGTKLNLYETIEDTMYGMYLHADENRILRLNIANEALRFSCVRKYVEDIDNVAFKLYECLEKLNINVGEKEKKDKASIVHLGNLKNNRQEIKKSLYWQNLYGRDATNEDYEQLIKKYNEEEAEIMIKALAFTNELSKEEFSEAYLDELIYPTTKVDWGDYKAAHNYYKSIIKPGISNIVRFNDKHTMAYVRIFPQVDESFVIKSPQIVGNVCEISFVKYNGEWKIYSIGSHLDSYIFED